MQTSEVQQIKLVRKFNTKFKLKYSEHIWLMARIQLVYQLLLIMTTCLANFSFHFHLSHMYTTEFWTSQDIASSNLGFAIGSLVMIVYTIHFQETKTSIIQDLHITKIFLHTLFCLIYNNFTFSFSYIVFTTVICIICITIAYFVASIVEQNILHHQISQIQMEDRRKKYGQEAQDMAEWVGLVGECGVQISTENKTNISCKS